MTSTTLTIDQLRLSPFNVRTDQRDVQNLTPLETSIKRLGLLLPLMVHPLKGERRAGQGLAGKYGVHAGGRRYRAIKALVERGELPVDWPVDVILVDLPEAGLIEASLAENLLRRDLRPYEEYAAVARAHKRGDTVEQIAEVLGQEPVWVRQALRLANLAEPVLRAYAEGRISTDQARAYAATEDQALQVQAFGQLGPAAIASAVRAWLKVGDAEAARLLRFVDADAYLAAGGRLEPDLFDDGEHQRGRVVDLGKLQELVEAKKETVRVDVRERLGRDIRFVADPPQGQYGGTDWQLQLRPLPPYTPEQAQRLDELRADPAADPAAIAAIEAARADPLPAGDVVARIAIDDAGEPKVDYWWASRKARHAGSRPARTATLDKAKADAASGTRGTRGAVRTGIAIDDGASPGAKRDADLAIKEEAGIGQDKVEIFRNLRTAILRALLIDDARERSSTLATDYLIWSQLRLAVAAREMRSESSAQVGMRHLDQDRSTAALLGRELIRATAAHRAWDDALAELRQHTFLSRPDHDEAFRDYHASAPYVKALAGAVVAGLAIERSLNADGYRLPVHDALAMMAGRSDDAALRRYWQPTPEFLELLPPKDRLAIAEPFVENAAFAGWSRLKGAELTRSVLSVVNGTADWLRRSTKGAACRWVHPLLAFRQDGGSPPPEPADNDQYDIEHAIEEAAE